MTQHRARLSDDGQWYFDGRTWHPVPSTVERRDAPDDAEDLNGTDPVDGRAAAVLGAEIVDNAALDLLRARAQAPYAWALVLTVLGVVVNAALAVQVPGTDSGTWFSQPAAHLLERAPFVGAATVTAAAFTMLLRGLLWVRLWTSPFLQGVTAAAIAISAYCLV